MQTSSLSTNKIVVLLVFLCASIMTSVFVFHLTHRQMPPQETQNNEGLIFPVAREVKDFTLLSEDHQFTQQNFKDHWTLLFFGFTHCASICPTTLAVINKAYPQLEKDHPNLQVVLVSLDPNRDTPETIQRYLQSFNPRFIGVTGKIQDLRKIQSQFGIYSSQNDASSENYQIEHTASIMLINPAGKWSGLIRAGLNPDQLIHAFRDNVKSFSQIKS